MEANEVIQLAAEIQQYRPIVEKVLEEFKEFYLPIFKAAGDYIVESAATKRLEVYRRFVDAGIPAGDALTLTIDTFSGVQRSLAALKQAGGK